MLYVSASIVMPSQVDQVRRESHIIAERISARQYKSGSILGIYRMYVRTYVRSSAQASTSRRSLRMRRRLDVYVRVYSIG